MEHGNNSLSGTPTPAPAQVMVRVRSVWSNNVDHEFSLIRAAVLQHRLVGMDTEFTGALYRPSCHPSAMTPDQHYALFRANVDAVNVLQVGLTLSDSHGPLPNLGDVGVGYVWEFNIRGFNVRRDPHVPESVELLRKQGMDFDAIVREGIEPRRFAEHMILSGLLLDEGSTITWATFQSVYDFGFLIKILTAGQTLPQSLGGFMNMVRCYFGNLVFDVKYIMRYCSGLHGGLEKVARDLNVDRPVGKGHQAGSDSLLTLQVFRKMLELHFAGGGVQQHAGRLFGLGA